MTRAEFDYFLAFGAGLCILLALVNALRRRSRGASAMWLSGACVAVAAALMVYRSGSDPAWVWVLGAAAFAMLVADFALRSKDRVLHGDKR